MAEKNILVLTYWSYQDALIQTYTLPYIKILREKGNSIGKVGLLTLEQGRYSINKEEQEGVKKKLLKGNIELLSVKYQPFGFKGFLMWGQLLPKLVYYCLNNKVSYIHAWCTPAGALGYVISLLTGIPLILDSFEPHAEPMVEAAVWKKNGLAFKLLFLLERLQAKRAKKVIACVDKMQEYASDKYALKIDNFHCKPAAVDFSLFDLKKRKNKALLHELGLEHKIVCVYAGKFGGSYLQQEVFDFFSVAYQHWGNKFRVLLLSAHPKHEIAAWMEACNIPKQIVLQEFVSHKKVPLYMGLADFGIIPFVPVPSKRYGSPIKTGEYMAMGLPTIITSNISDDSEIIEGEGIGYVLKGLNRAEYQNAIFTMEKLLHGEEKHRIESRICDVAKKYKTFTIAERVYQEVYSD